ncbi:MipA/OmpV family protein [Agaribacterium haliotis]|uniref:MipA/OmpV family protein n=1 Tax=Agaribacterium haliotis TaxID=2013869 RepID=UPI000BB55C28|nr:MipA/OmpV family protein [Agaribacterium haliotis]
MIFKQLSLALLCLLCSCLSLAQDIANSVRDQGQHELTDGGYLELGLGAGYVNTPRHLLQTSYEDWVGDLSFAGEFRYRALFFEAAQATQDGLNVGFNLWHNEEWLVDLLLASVSGDVVDEDDGIDRDTLYSGAGVRVTRYFGPSVLQFRLVNDIYGQHGTVSTVRLGRAWQLKNWLVHAIGSVQYNSESTNNYWFGVSKAQSDYDTPEFRASASTQASILAGATYPLSERFVFRAYAGLDQYPESVRESPVVDDYNESYVFITFNYVIF